MGLANGPHHVEAPEKLVDVANVRGLDSFGQLCPQSEVDEGAQRRILGQVCVAVAVELAKGIVLDVPDDLQGLWDQVLGPNGPFGMLDLPRGLQTRELPLVEVEDVLVNVVENQRRRQRAVPVDDMVQAFAGLHLAMNQWRK